MARTANPDRYRSQNHIAHQALGMSIPPVNFALVVGQVYRSGHPTESNHRFLESLQLKTIVYVGNAAPPEVSAEFEKWIDSQNIKLIKSPMKPVKEPFQGDDPEVVENAIKYVLDERNHPILVHSDKGKHRVSVVVAAIRKCSQMWASAPIYEEYIRFAKGKASSDFLFIEQFQLADPGVNSQHYPKWVHLADP